MRPDLARIAVPGQRRKLLPCRGTEQLAERPPLRARELSDGAHADLFEPRFRGRTHAPHQLDGQRVEELQLGRRIDDHEAVGLCDLRGDLCEMFCARDADRHRKAKLVVHAAADRSRDLVRRTEQMRATRNVGERLIDGDALHERREIADHLDRGIAEPLVVLEVTADKYELRTQLARLPSRHAAAHPKSLRFVGRGKHDPAADGDRFAAQRRIKQLLYRSIKGVQVRMQDGGSRGHPDRSPDVFGTRT
jgi:hypothetical protein